MNLVAGTTFRPAVINISTASDQSDSSIQQSCAIKYCINFCVFHWFQIEVIDEFCTLKVAALTVYLLEK